MAIADVVKAITVTAELTQATMSAAAISVMAQDLLSAYSEDQVIRALVRCRREIRRPLTSGDVFERLCENDGRPGVEEAWAMCPRSEADSVCWTLEMREAYSIARSLSDNGDTIGARMAFKDAYERLVRESRESGFRTSWELSLGWDGGGRQKAVEKAVSVKVITAQAAVAMLPPPPGGMNLIQHLIGQEPLRIAGPDLDVEDVRKRVAKLKQDLASSSQEKARAKSEASKAERDKFEQSKKAAAELVRSKSNNRAEA